MPIVIIVIIVINVIIVTIIIIDLRREQAVQQSRIESFRLQLQEVSSIPDPSPSLRVRKSLDLEQNGASIGVCVFVGV
jgi:hypothetical protein